MYILSPSWRWSVQWPWTVTYILIIVIIMLDVNSEMLKQKIFLYRLLNYDVDKWVHLNCALWSEEVYETENGALVNVEVAIKQSATLACIICKQFGASVKCFKVRCTSVYHVGCAVKDGCAFYKNKVSLATMFLRICCSIVFKK